MKLNKALMLTALMTGSFFTGNLALQAQDATPTNNPPTATPPPNTGAVRARNSFDTIAKQLDLTDDQKLKVKPIIDDMQQQIRDLRNDQSVPMTEKRTKMRDIRTATTEKLKALNVLSDDQLAKWQKMGMGNRRPPGGAAPGSTPPAVDGNAPAAPAAPATPSPGTAPDSTK